MGVYDRDWWKEHRAQQERLEQEQIKCDQPPPVDQPPNPSRKKSHWTLQLLTWGWVFVVVYLIIKRLHGLPL
nr:MAG TPA: hypothetical protein [Inoviridae sp.]